jgi:hypothetical protein
MPIHLKDLDVVSHAAGVSSALIVPCNMCPAVTVAVNQKQPFMRLFRSWLKSAPFEQHIEDLQSRLREKGVKADVFKSRLYHQWFVCMWTTGRRKKLRKAAEEYEAVISLGCDTANETVREAVKPNGCTVIEGMEIAGLMNARMSLSLPCDISFVDCTIVPISQQRKSEDMPV